MAETVDNDSSKETNPMDGEEKNNEEINDIDVQSQERVHVEQTNNIDQLQESNKSLRTDNPPLQEKKTSENAQEKHVSYVPPLDNPYEKAWKFLYKHDILTLFQGITASIVAGRPDEPIDYMIEEIEKIQEQDQVRKGVIKQEITEADNSENV